jgi:hypothetical protein
MAADPVLTRARFHGLLQMLLPLLPAVNDGELAEVEHRGAPGAQSAPSLRTRQPAADPRRKRLSRHRERCCHLMPREFAFSVDNVRSVAIAPWYTLHDDSHENIYNAEAVGIIRNDEAFRIRFDERLDALLAQNGVCRRQPDGYLGIADEQVTEAAPDQRTAAIIQQFDNEGFVDDAVTVLRRAGRHTWRNAAGHIAMRPVWPRPLAAPAVELCPGHSGAGRQRADGRSSGVRPAK